MSEPLTCRWNVAQIDAMFSRPDSSISFREPMRALIRSRQEGCLNSLGIIVGQIITQLYQFAQHSVEVKQNVLPVEKDGVGLLGGVVRSFADDGEPDDESLQFQRLFPKVILYLKDIVIVNP